MICPSCHAQIAEGKKFCGACGAALAPNGQASVAVAPSSPRCRKCGSKVSPAKKFCGVCGSPIGTQQVQSPDALPNTRTPASSPGELPRPSAASRPRVSAPISTPSAPPTQWGTPRETIDTDISKPPIKLPSGKVLGSISAVVILLLCAAGWYMWGVELELITDPGGAEVMLDGKPVGRTVGQGGSLVLPHLAHGTHSLSLTHPGFDEWAQPVALGWFHLAHPLKVVLPVPTFPLTVLTIPASAKVQIDGQDTGATGPDGTLLVPKVPRGQHVVTVTMQGYPTWSNSVWVGAPLSIRADLAAAAAAAQQEIASRLGRAQTLFQQREYQAAIAECDAVLHLDPSNQEAANLKSQIQQTMSILGVQ